MPSNHNTMIDFNKLYEKLADKQFQDTENTDFFYNYFIVQYSIQEEKEVEDTLDKFKEVLSRPTNYVDVLSLDIFEELCNFLDGRRFFKYDSQLQYLLDKDKTMPEAVTNSLVNMANNDEFYEYINKRILDHINKTGDNMIRPYVFFYGISRIYPYLRTNVLLTAYEKYNRANKYKVILFYPGSQIGNSFSLFDKLEDSHTYRATFLLNNPT